MPKKIKTYFDEYDEFIESYEKGQVDGEDLGIIIAKMAHYFAHYNNQLCEAERKATIVARDIEMRVDESTGKAMTNSKAKTMVAATKEGHELLETKTHLQNVEQYINALKSLQKGVLNEYSHMSKL